MVTIGLVLLAVLLVFGMVAVVHQMCTSPLLWFYHVVGGTFGFLGNLFVAVLGALFTSD